MKLKENNRIEGDEKKEKNEKLWNKYKIIIFSKTWIKEN